MSHLCGLGFHHYQGSAGFPGAYEDYHRLFPKKNGLSIALKPPNGNFVHEINATEEVLSRWRIQMQKSSITRWLRSPENLSILVWKTNCSMLDQFQKIYSHFTRNFFRFIWVVRWVSVFLCFLCSYFCLKWKCKMTIRREFYIIHLTKIFIFVKNIEIL